jgi:two-component system, NtrC family, sensor histidine kinase KinB
MRASLRFRLLAALLALVAALAGLGAWSAWRLRDMGRVAQRILADNYLSIEAARVMEVSLERLDAARRAGAAAEEAEQERRFRGAMAAAAGNITELGEREIVGDITVRFERYLGMPAGPGEIDTLRSATLDLLRLNEEAMRRKSDEAGAVARRNVAWVTGLALLLIALGVAVTMAVAGRVVRPIEALTAAAARIAAGDLEVAVPADRRDEVGLLARSFNDMAARLREVRAADLGALLQARQLAEAAIDALYDAVVVTDATGHITRLNTAAEAVFGRAADVTGRPLTAAAPDARMAAAVDEVLRSQRAFAREGTASTVVLTRNGVEHVYRLRSTPLPDAHGELAGAVLLLEDVTRLHQIDRLKSEFIAAASHELRTPLGSLQLGLNLVLEDPGSLSPRQLEILGLCRADADRLARLTRDLLDLSRLESGEHTLRLRAVDAAGLIRGAVKPLRLTAEARQLRLDVDLPASLPLVSADRLQIERVVANLLSNALRATTAGGRIVVSAAPRPDALAISVADTGVGIPADQLTSIFDAFVQVPGGAAGGAGLGLALCRRIVEAHGGQLTVQSRPGHGSVFTFTLPLARPDGEESRDASVNRR